MFHNGVGSGAPRGSWPGSTREALAIPPDSRIAHGVATRQYPGMEEPARISNEPRSLSDYWTVACAVLLVLIVSYAVFTGT